MSKSLFAALLLLSAAIPTLAHADDMVDVQAASAAFYASLSVLDDGSAMAKVFADTDYVTFVGPRKKTVIVGAKALTGYFNTANKMFKARKTTITDSHMHINGNVAWEVGLEKGENTMADGKVLPVDWVVTNVFEKQGDGRWLMVSHHVQPGPKEP
jgi:ketosteroid isomerase-like protein